MQFDTESLKKSNDFLNAVINTITSAIFLVDKDIRIKNFNDSFQALFKKSEKEIIGKLCGNGIGCFYTVVENTSCGSTSYCGECIIRKCLLKLFVIPSKEDSRKNA